MIVRTLRAGLLFAGVTLLLTTGCSRKLREYKPGMVYQPNETVLRVDGQKQTWDQMEKRARNLLKEEVDAKTLFVPQGEEEKALEFFRRKTQTLFVNKTVMLAEARRRGLEVTPAERQKYVAEVEGVLKARGTATSIEDFFKKSPLGEKEMRNEFEDGLLIDKLLQEAIRNKITVTDADRDALAAEIIAKRKEAKQKAAEIHAQLQKGADFNSLMKSDDKRVVGGEIGEVTRGKIGDKQIEDAIFVQKVNEVGPVLETGRGYMLIRVTARTPAKAAVGATPATPESVHASFISVRTPPVLKSKDMDRVIQERKFEKSLMELLKSLRAKSKIETIYKDLAF